MERHDFLKKAGMTAAGALATTAGLAACAQQKQEEAKAPAVQAKKTYEWKMVTTWPPNLPVLQTGAERFAKRVEEATGGTSSRTLSLEIGSGFSSIKVLGEGEEKI